MRLIQILERYLLLLGYEIIDTNDTEANGYSLIKAGAVDNVGTLENTMFENIINTYGNAKYYYDQANSTFINGDYNSTIVVAVNYQKLYVTAKPGSQSVEIQFLNYQIFLLMMTKVKQKILIKQLNIGVKRKNMFLFLLDCILYIIVYVNMVLIHQ